MIDHSNGRLAAVVDFANRQGLAAQLDERLAYLSGWGGLGCHCVLGYDPAPHSLSFAIVDAGRCRLVGGLIYHPPAVGSAGPPTRATTGPMVGWVVHT